MPYQRAVQSGCRATEHAAIVGPGETATLDVWLARLGGFEGAVELSVSGLPPGASSSFDTSGFTATESGWRRLTIQLASSGGTGLHEVTVEASSSGQPARVAKARLNVEAGVVGAAGAPRMVLRSGVTSKPVELPVKIQWSAVKNAQRYELHVSRDGGSWANLSLPSRTATAINKPAWPGSTYRYRVRVRKNDAWAAWLLGPPTVVTPQFAGEAVSLSGSWVSYANSKTYSEVPAYSKQASAQARLDFTGRSVSWITSRGPTRGKARVYMDGVLAAKIDLYASTVRHRRVVFSRSWTSAGDHRIVIEVRGTSGRPRVDVDAIVVVSTN